MPLILGRQWFGPGKPEGLKPRLSEHLIRYAKHVWPLNFSYVNVGDPHTTAFAQGASTAAPLWGARNGGSGLIFDGSNDIATATAPEAVAAFPVWVAAGYTFDTVPGATQNAFCLSRNTSSSGALMNLEGSAGGAVQCRFRNGNGGPIATITGPAIVTDKTYNVLFISRSATNHVAYINGVRFSSTTDIGTTWDSAITALSLGAQRLLANTNFLDGAVHWAAYGTKDPGDGFIQDFTLNPYKHMYRDEYPIWVNASPAGGGGGANPWHYYAQLRRAA